MLTCPDCGTADATMIDDNGVTDPAEGDRWEKYECGDGHTFSKTLHA